MLWMPVWLCGGLETLYGAASETGYQKLMEVMEGLGEAI